MIWLFGLRTERKGFGTCQASNNQSIVTRAKYGQVENLPLPKKGTIFIVSALVLQAVPGRLDVFAPGPALRDEAGKIIGADGLSANISTISTMDREKVSPELSAVIAAEKENLKKEEMKTGDVISVPRYRVVAGNITKEVTMTSATIVKVGRKWLTVQFPNGERGVIEKSHVQPK